MHDEIQTSLDEIFGFASDEIKSASINLALAGFHHVCIPLAVYCVIRRARPTNSKFHPTLVGFIPTEADLTEKDSRLYPILSLFLANKYNFDTKTIPRRDSVPFQPHNVL